MRVLVVAAWPPWPLTDGARLVLHHQLRHLADRHAISLLSPRRGTLDHVGVEPVPGVEVQLLGGEPSRRTWAEARLSSITAREPIEVARVLTPAVRRAVSAEIDTFAPDIVHLFGWGTAALAGRVPLPCVHTALDSWTRGERDRRGTGPAHRLKALLEADQTWWIRRHERRHYPRCEAVIVVSRADADAIADVAPRARVVVISNGVECGPPVDEADEADLVGFHGAFANRANLDAAAALVKEVMPRVRASRPGARLLIAGRGADRVGPVPDWVEVAPDVPSMRHVLSRMAVHAAPMVSGTGLKNKVLEAMAAGRPVVTNRRGLGGIGAGDGIVVADSSADIAQSVVDLLADPARRRAIGRAGRTRVEEHFSWEASARELETVWSHAVVEQSRLGAVEGQGDLGGRRSP